MKTLNRASFSIHFSVEQQESLRNLFWTCFVVKPVLLFRSGQKFGIFDKIIVVGR